MKKEFRKGIADGIPIAIGYLSVSFSLGIAMLNCGLSAFAGTLMSLINVTSAGEFAGLQIIAASGTLLEIILTQFIINLRYALMSLSLSQKLSTDMKLWQRLVVAFGNTDEIFAVAMNHQKDLTFPYMFGLQMLPIIGWTLGTYLGIVAAKLMPTSVSTAMGVALYGMFIAIVIPVAKRSKPVCFVTALAICISCIFYYVPIFSFISSGISIIVATILSAGIGALLFPINEAEPEDITTDVSENNSCNLSQSSSEKGGTE